jgi:2-polyprenyl-3-methyl-5-hydroxy-6-metoxy-1,4-benzoquinol methylase
MPEDCFADRVAERYDETSAELFAPEAVEPVVDSSPTSLPVVRFSSSGSARGRIALPLWRRGVRVHGIDLSPDMVAQPRAKPGGAGLHGESQSNEEFATKLKERFPERQEPGWIDFSALLLYGIVNP